MSFGVTCGKIRYETSISLEQNLTFKYATNTFDEAGLQLQTTQMKTLGMLDINGDYTNLALLLSDQCKHTIKCSVFTDTTVDIFQDRKEFNGSVLKQVEDAASYLNLINLISSTIGSLRRIDTYKYPQIAVREALLNAVAHRDYAFESGGFMLKMFSDRIEFFNMGGLLLDANEKDILNGMSLPRNPSLSNIFLKLDWVENFGSGIPRIFAQYKNSDNKPMFDISFTSFKVMLPSSNIVESQNLTFDELSKSSEFQ